MSEMSAEYAVKVKGKDAEGVADVPEQKSTVPTAPQNYLSYVDDDNDFDDDVPTSHPPTHEDNADPIVPPRQVSTRPGWVRTKAEIVLHTNIAHRLFYGRRRNDKEKIKAIIGLVRFSINVNNIFECASHDDPWADAVLVDIEKRFSATNKLVKENTEVLDQLLDGMEGLRICINESVSPVTLPVEFRTVYGFMGARLLGQFDNLVRQGLVARHVGLIFKDDWGKLVMEAGKKIRDLFFLSTRYRYTGVTRNDVATNNEIARRALEKNGKLSQNILEGAHEFRAKHAPYIRQTGNLGLAQQSKTETES